MPNSPSVRPGLAGLAVLIAILGCSLPFPGTAPELPATPQSSSTFAPSSTSAPSSTPTNIPSTPTPEWIRISAENVLEIDPLMTLAGHENIVRAISISSDGTRLAVGTGGLSSRDVYRLSLWDPETGELIARSEELGGIVWDVAFSPDGQLLAAAIETGLIRVWRSETLEPVAKLEHPGPVNSLAFSPDGGLLAAGVAESEGGIAVIWRLEDQTVLRRFWAHPYSVPTMDFSPTGQFLATGATDRSIKIWQVSNAELLETLPQDGQGTSLEFSNDGRLLASGMCALSDPQLNCLEGEVWLREAGTWELIRVLDGPVDWVEGIAFAPGAELLAAAARDFGIYLWRVSDGELLRVMVGHGGMVADVDFSPDGRQLASGSSDETVILWGIAP